MKSSSISFVLAADYAYHPYVETTLKSLHVHHEKMTVYLINKDFPEQWFEKINSYFGVKSSVIIDKKIDIPQFVDFKTWSHIKEATFYRYCIPVLIPEERVIYLDSDIIVTGSLNSLWETNLENKSLGAVPDFIVKTLHHRIDFNAGVLLIDNKKWQAKKVLDQALAYHDEKTVGLDADQEVLNSLFENDWLQVDETYNFQTAYDFQEHRTGQPLVIHYTTSQKPWNNRIGSVLYRLKLLLRQKITIYEAVTNKKNLPKETAQVWFDYNTLSWEDRYLNEY